MSSRRLPRAGIFASSEPWAEGVASASNARPRPRGVDSGRVSSQQRPAVLGRGEEDEGSYRISEERGEGRPRSAKRLKATVTVSDFLRWYTGGRYDFSARWKAVRCPFHQDSHASASYNDAIGQFYCHGCEYHGDIFDLVQILEGISFPEAVTFIEEYF